MASKAESKKSLSKRLVNTIESIGSAVKTGATTFLQAFSGPNSHNHFKMLLIGETGSGKTSFLNLLYNCGTVQALGCGFGKEGLEHFKQFHDIKLENAQSLSMESKTNEATLYNVEVGHLKVGIIDTPGFGDSRGLKQDEENVKSIIGVLKNEDHINCVCLIINGRQPRASASLKYVLTEITAILPREILNNVIVVFSNTCDPLDLTFDPKTLTDYFGRDVKQEHIFFVENPYCRFEKAKAKVDQLGIEKIAKSLQKSFEDAAAVLDEMCQTIKDFKEVHTLRFIVLHEKKQAIEGKILQLLTAYDNQVRLERAIRDTEEEVDAAVKSKTLNKDFSSTQKYKKVIVDKTQYHNTLCRYSQCESNCHEMCSLPKSLDYETFLRCACMGSNSICKVCHHSYTYHYHGESLFREVEETKDLVDDEMRQKFEEAKDAEEQAQILYKELKRQKEESITERERLSVELMDNISEFEELGVARNYIKLIENQIAVIETRLKGTIGKQCQQLRNTKIELEKKLKLVKEAKSGPNA